MALSLGQRSPETVLELSVYNLLSHIAVVDMSPEQISEFLLAKWTPGPLTDPPTIEAVRGAVERLRMQGVQVQRLLIIRNLDASSGPS